MGASFKIFSLIVEVPDVLFMALPVIFIFYVLSFF